jgi:hypothetical protein
MLACPALSLHRESHRLLVRERTPGLTLQSLEGMTPREPPHLLQALSRDERGERLALALDVELVVPQRNSIEQIADPAPDIFSGHFPRHDPHPLQLY